MASANSPLTIAFSGPPALGKSTLAKIVSEKLGVKWVDHEVHCRVSYFGPGHPDPDASEELRRDFNVMQAASYDILFAVLGAYLDLGRSIVVSATFVSDRSQQNLFETVAHRGLPLCLIWCFSEEDTDEAVVIRLAGREFGKDYFGGVNDLRSYREQKARWSKPPSVPHCTVDTFRYPIEACVKMVLSYIETLHPAMASEERR